MPARHYQERIKAPTQELREKLREKWPQKHFHAGAEAGNAHLL
jgi:hypothetical protein